MHRPELPIELTTVPVLEVLAEVPRFHTREQVFLDARNIAGWRNPDIRAQFCKAPAQDLGRRAPSERPNRLVDGDVG
jgi:hypothetical protein